MSLFTVGDLHLSMGGDKPMTVFRGWENHMQRLEENWRARIGPEDTVVIPGDLSWSMNMEHAIADFDFLNRLPGQKIISKGNHDYYWSTMAKMNAFLTDHDFSTIRILFNNCIPIDGFLICGSRGWMPEGGDAFNRKILAREAGRLEMSLAAADQMEGEKLAFLHYPPIYNGTKLTELTDVLEKHGVRQCFYGHLHGRMISAAFQGKKDGVQYTLCSLDGLGFAPLQILPAAKTDEQLEKDSLKLQNSEKNTV